jgi:cytochrome c peroxidase
MDYSRAVLAAVVAVLFLAASGCSQQPTGSPAVDAAKLKIFTPLPDAVPAPTGLPSDERANLGRMLYYETRLSKDQKISCNNCHQLTKYGVDGEVTSEGHKGQRGDRNSPTVYNAAAHFAQFWDGRAVDVEAQAKGPVMNPVEMALPSETVAVATLKSMPEYVAMFKEAFPGEKDPITFNNMAIAIGAFERRLMTPARWDKFLKGDQNALTPEEKAGLNTFLKAGCQTCHAGTLLGGNMYQKIGLAKPFPDASDPGRAKVTKNEGDQQFFKVPSLRNVEKTAPYFHNGRIPTLEVAVADMGEYQLGDKLSDADVKSIVVFLKSLTGEIPEKYIQPPELPKSTPKTPKPEAAD